MAYMNIILSELLVQALRQGPQRELSRSESTGVHIAPKTRCCPSKNKCSPFTDARLDFILFERENSLPGKGKSGDDIDLSRLLNVLRCHIQKLLERAMAGIPDTDSDRV